MTDLFDPLDFERLRGEAALAVYIDLKSPYAYLAIGPTRDMAARLGVQIDWRPFTLDIPSYLGSAKLKNDGKKVEQSKLDCAAGRTVVNDPASFVLGVRI